MHRAAPLLLLLMAWTAKPQATEPAPAYAANAANGATAVVSGPSDLLTVADIRIAAGVNTTHAPTLDAINCLRRFLRGKVQAKGKGEMELYFVERNTA